VVVRRGTARDAVWTARTVRRLGVITDLVTAASIFDVSRSSAYDLVRRGRFPVPVIRVGGAYRVPVAPIMELLHLTGARTQDGDSRPHGAGQADASPSGAPHPVSTPTPRPVAPRQRSTPEGALFKRCGCRESDGRRSGARCAQLHRPTGGWSESHGTWGYRLELPTEEGDPRRQLRHSGFATRQAARAERDQARILLTVAAGDPTLQRAVAALLQRHRPGAALPEPDTLAGQLQAVVAPTATLTVGRYLTEWLAGRRIAATTRHSYAQHIRLYLGPHLGHHPLRELTGSHIQAMYTAVGLESEAIARARGSGDPDVRATVRGRRPLSPATIHKIHTTSSKALNDAVRKHHLIPHNPAVAVELPEARPASGAGLEEPRRRGVAPQRASPQSCHGLDSTAGRCVPRPRRV
jgi:hypothetical protein